MGQAWTPEANWGRLAVFKCFYAVGSLFEVAGGLVSRRHSGSWGV